jgi:hypothetical protein
MTTLGGQLAHLVAVTLEPTTEDRSMFMSAKQVIVAISLVLTLGMIAPSAANAAPKCYGAYGSNGVTAGYYCER